MSNSASETFFSERRIYGDDFGPDALAQWFAEEKNGYYDLTQTYGKDWAYEYHALNDFHAWRHLSTRRFGACLVLGCAAGEDVLPIAPRVDRFVAIEPAEQWWKSHIGGKPAQYLMPEVDGTIPCPSESIDLAVSLNTLHHIPNVSYVLNETIRTLRPGGLLVLNEPISTMGDWRFPRRGLTKNERGFPIKWLDQTLIDKGISIKRRAFCMFPLFPRLARLLRMRSAYLSKSMVFADAALSGLLSFNLYYHRSSVLKKLAPHNVFYIAEKAGSAERGTMRRRLVVPTSPAFKTFGPLVKSKRLTN